MQDFFLSILLGIIEGLTEFIPVSSTAHLRLAEALLHVDLRDGFWKMYTIVIQLGAILALPVYFWNRILNLLASFPRGESGRRNALTHPLGLTMVAFVVTAVPAWALKKQIGANLENLHVMAWAILIGGLIMWLVDVLFRTVRVTHMEEMSFLQAVWIGAAQILSAVFPGTSRSMSTIAAGQLAGMSRMAALEFSFFLSMPTMAVATLYDLMKVVRPHHDVDLADNLAPLTMTTHSWVVLAIGFVVSFVVALIVVAWFMRWVRDRGFVPFALYRVALGLIMLILLLFGVL
ncbi:MAG: undecaprenyl-diphosphate phosphatase [Spartobacteria bacterium]